MFSGCPSVRPCVRPCVRYTSSLTRLRMNGPRDFNQTLHKCSVPSVDELISFWQGSNQRWPPADHLTIHQQHNFVSAISYVLHDGFSSNKIYEVATIGS